MIPDSHIYHVTAPAGAGKTSVAARLARLQLTPEKKLLWCDWNGALTDHDRHVIPDQFTHFSPQGWDDAREFLRTCPEDVIVLDGLDLAFGFDTFGLVTLLVTARVEGYLKALQDAKTNGQTALVEKLSKDVEAVRAETQLHAIGLPKYVSEENVVRFYKETQKGLRLDYTRNFLRVIPADVAATKASCDELGLFDNYAVMHYDPEAKSYAQTEEEKEAERRRKSDPILFGMISGRRRLYFVGDWVDEHCDLTLEQIADLIGESAVEQVTPEFKVG